MLYNLRLAICCLFSSVANSFQHSLARMAKNVWPKFLKPHQNRNLWKFQVFNAFMLSYGKILEQEILRIRPLFRPLQENLAKILLLLTFFLGPFWVMQTKNRPVGNTAVLAYFGLHLRDWLLQHRGHLDLQKAQLWLQPGDFCFYSNVTKLNLPEALLLLSKIVFY